MSKEGGWRVGGKGRVSNQWRESVMFVSPCNTATLWGQVVRPGYCALPLRLLLISPLSTVYCHHTHAHSHTHTHTCAHSQNCVNFRWQLFIVKWTALFACKKEGVSTQILISNQMTQPTSSSALGQVECYKSNRPVSCWIESNSGFHKFYCCGWDAFR